jgi:hypothetical protein
MHPRSLSHVLYCTSADSAIRVYYLKRMHTAAAHAVFLFGKPVPLINPLRPCLLSASAIFSFRSLFHQLPTRPIARIISLASSLAHSPLLVSSPNGKSHSYVRKAAPA